MATSVPWTARPRDAVRLRMRPDLVVYPLAFRRQNYWGVKDPVAARYFQLGLEEFSILKMLDGRASLTDIKTRFETSFPPKKLSLSRLHDMIGQLYRCGLLLAEAPGQSRSLLKREEESIRWRRFGVWTNLLAIRFRGCDPSTFLEWLYARCRILFTRPAASLCAVMALCAALLVLVQWDTIQRRLPEAQVLLRYDNLLWIAVTLACVKVLHELGHALMCRHFGGDCHEMGVMLLVLTPCLYCNVTDAWMLRSKWQRMAISGAGILVEVVLASIATFLWWFSHPGWIHAMCLNVMIVCSVGTILFNGNPLLRYDGYYLLADLVEAPNLWDQSRAALRRSLGSLCLGLPQTGGRWIDRGRNALLLAYGAASTAYRWLILGTIVWFLYRLLEAWRLQWIGHIGLTVLMVGMCVPPLLAFRAFWQDPIRRSRVRRNRVVGTCVVLLVAGILLAAVPFPCRVEAPALLQFADAQRVFVPVAGRLLDSVAIGEHVEKDQVLARLENLDLSLKVTRLEGQRDQIQQHVAQLMSRRADDPAAAAQIPAARQSLASVQQQLDGLREDQRQLVLSAPGDGFVLPPPELYKEQGQRGELPSWWSIPQNPRNTGCTLKTGSLYCLVGQPERLETMAFVDEDDVQFVREGQSVRIRLDQLPWRILSGSVNELSRLDLKHAPRQLATHPDLSSHRDAEGRSQPLDTLYIVRVTFTKPPPSWLLAGAIGNAKITVDPQPILHRCVRSIARTFRFR